MQLDVVHETRYGYTAPVSLAHHLAHLAPLDDAHQRRLSFALEIEPAPAHLREGRDAHGNSCHWFTLTQPHQELVVRSHSVVEVAPRFAQLAPGSGPAWDDVAARMRYVARAEPERTVEFTMPSPYVPRLEALRQYAQPSFTPGRPVAEAAIDLMHRLHADFAYRSQSTQVDTPLAEVFALRSGVCQDFAHLMACALRMMGVPARYVSGYLLTRAPEDGHAMLGADASHAWVQVWCPGTHGVPADGAGAGWLDLDPTNDLVPGAGHVRVATGRDFGDVTPLRGVIRGGGRHSLSVGVTTRVAGPLVACE